MFRRPKRHYRKASPAPSSALSSRSSSPSKSTASHIILPSELPTPRRPRNTEDMYLPGPERLFVLPGEEYTQQPSPSRSRGRMPRVNEDPTGLPLPTRDPSPFAYDDIFMTSQLDPDQQPFIQRKKQKQWQRWTNEVIPSLISPYLSLLRTTESLRSIPQPMVVECSCNSHARNLKVVGVYFESTFDMFVLYYLQLDFMSTIYSWLTLYHKAYLYFVLLVY